MVSERKDGCMHAMGLIFFHMIVIEPAIGGLNGTIFTEIVSAHSPV